MTPPLHAGESRLLKYTSLVLLVVQNCSAVLLIRYVKTRPVDGERFTTTGIVFVQELVKCIIAAGIVLFNAHGSVATGAAEVSHDFSKAAVPAALFALQNTLLFVALGNLEATLFQVTYQAKLLCTAVLMVLMLGLKLNPRKWAALLLLFAGIIATQLAASKKTAPAQREMSTVVSVAPGSVVQNAQAFMAARRLLPDPDDALNGHEPTNRRDDATPPPQPISRPRKSSEKRLLSIRREEDEPETMPQTREVSEPPVVKDRVTGLLAVAVCSTSSGFASVYTEKILKQSSVGLWARNVQLAAMSGAFAGVFFLASHSPWSLFVGFDGVVWLLVMVQAAGGFLVSAVMKYADNLLKGFATSIAIIVSGVVSYLFLDFVPSVGFLLGAVIVISATVMYSLPEPQHAHQSGNSTPTNKPQQ